MKYVGCQQIMSEGATNTVVTVSINITVSDDTHIKILTTAMDHSFSDGHPSLDALSVLGVYGIPR